MSIGPHPFEHADLAAVARGPMRAPEFARTARMIGDVARRGGWRVPSFHSPPRLVGVNRTIRRRGNDDEAPVASIRLRERPPLAVVGDMIEAVVVVNSLASPASDRVRDALWSALHDESSQCDGAPVAAA